MVPESGGHAGVIAGAANGRGAEASGQVSAVGRRWVVGRAVPGRVGEL